MKIKDRIKTTSFWVGLIGSVFLILGAFGVEIGDDTASAIINVVCSLLVLFGVVSAPQKTDTEEGGTDVADESVCDTAIDKTENENENN